MPVIATARTKQEAHPPRSSLRPGPGLPFLKPSTRTAQTYRGRSPLPGPRQPEQSPGRTRATDRKIEKARSRRPSSASAKRAHAWKNSGPEKERASQSSSALRVRRRAQCTARWRPRTGFPATLTPHQRATRHDASRPLTVLRGYGPMVHEVEKCMV